MGKKTGKFVYWTPRILAILFILFLAMFSLDIFEGNYGFWGTIVGLFMHNIPAMILLIFLIISWKHELVGGVSFSLFGIGYITMTIVRGVLSSGLPWYIGLSWSITIAGPAFLIGILFLIGWFRKKSIREKLFEEPKISKAKLKLVKKLARISIKKNLLGTEKQLIKKLKKK